MTGLTKFGPPAESHIQMVMQEYNLTRQELTGERKLHKLMLPAPKPQIIT